MMDRTQATIVLAAIDLLGTGAEEPPVSATDHARRLEMRGSIEDAVMTCLAGWRCDMVASLWQGWQGPGVDRWTFGQPEHEEMMRSGIRALGRSMRSHYTRSQVETAVQRAADRVDDGDRHEIRDAMHARIADVIERDVRTGTMSDARGALEALGLIWEEGVQ